MNRKQIKQSISTIKEIDQAGNVTKETIEQNQTTYITNDEPDYIKLYTNMWCEFNRIPNKWRNLFFELIIRMTYVDAQDLKSSQVVATGGPTKKAICDKLGWNDNNYQKGLKELVNAKAIRKIQRGFYQINPNYAGKGEWNYNQRLKRGGIKELKALFNFTTKNVDLDITWVDNQEEYPEGYLYKLEQTQNDPDQLPGQQKIV